MNTQITTLLQSLALAALIAVAPVALAVDGVKLIDMAKVTTGGLTPGDASGFPVTISQPGSYQLSGNLTVPNADTTAIEIAASHVTVDLNGFAILGLTDCSGGLNPCAGAGAGRGIATVDAMFSLTPQFNITIRNGTIQGMGSFGIFLRGDSHLVEYMHVRSNGNGGITINQSVDSGSSIVHHSTAQRNGGYGIFVSQGSVSHNVADVNETGITLITGTASDNVVTRNFDRGINAGDSASYFGNTMTFNGTNVTGGVNLGQNLCGTTACP